LLDSGQKQHLPLIRWKSIHLLEHLSQLDVIELIAWLGYLPRSPPFTFGIQRDVSRFAPSAHTLVYVDAVHDREHPGAQV